MPRHMTGKHIEEGINPKVNAAAGGAAIAGAITTVVVWLLSFVGVEMPSEVQGAITVILASAGAWVGGWLKADTR